MARPARPESTGECDDLGAATAFAPSAVGAVTWAALRPSVAGLDRMINEALGAWLLKSPSLNTRASYPLDLNRFLDFAGCRRMRVLCGRAASRAGRWRRDREVRWSSVHDVPDIIRASGRSLSVGDGLVRGDVRLAQRWYTRYPAASVLAQLGEGGQTPAASS
jgi:hypothetical protein